MNYRLLAKQLAIVALLIGATMVLSLPWAIPALGHRTEEKLGDAFPFETWGFLALLASMAVCLAVAGLLWWWGRTADGPLYRKEAMAVVGLSWVLATLLGALPFVLSGTYRAPSVRLLGSEHPPQLFRHGLKDPLLNEQYRIVEALVQAGGRGLTPEQLAGQTSDSPPSLANTPHASQVLHELADSNPLWRRAIIFPEDDEGTPRRRGNYRIRWIRMNLTDALFESQSGFSTTGATVIVDLEDPVLVPRCILFWRSSTHFLGGLGIIVLFVAILGQGSAGKALMRAEIPGPSKEGSQTRMQHAAWTFAVIYVVLNIVLTVILTLAGLSLFDAMCHAFGSMATGGFSTYNLSVGHFQNVPGVSAVVVEYAILIFMVLAGSNFTLLYFLAILRPGRMLADIEWRTYVTILVLATLLIVLFGHFHDDFRHTRQASWLQYLSDSFRYASFQVVSVMTTTGYGTHDFDSWNSFARGLLFLLMFVGGCAGSTGGGLKVIRHILFHKILWLEVEHAYHPSVVRPLRLGGKPVDDPDLRHNILVYFGVILFLFVASWMLILTIEPDATWGAHEHQIRHKLIDTASAVAATLNNIGPGLGVVGSTENYTNFSGPTKLLFVVLMMIGRLEIFAIVVLFMPGFWRAR